MIDRKKKFCKGCHQPRIIFGHGLCQSCYRKEQARKQIMRNRNMPVEARQGVLNRMKAKSGHRIPPRTKSRLKSEVEYHKIISVMDKRKGIKCFFCGEKMKHPEDHHHLLGRDGDLLIDKRYIVHAHRTCHDQYHTSPVGKIKWFMDYVNRVSDIDPELAEREIRKFNK